MEERVKKKAVHKFHDPSFCLFFWLPIFQRFSRCIHIYRHRLSLLPRPSRSQIGTSKNMYIYEWYKFGVKSLKYTRRIVVVYSWRKFCVERWGFDITGVKCLGMDFALITPLWARVSSPHPRNDSASNAYIIIHRYISTEAVVYCREGSGDGGKYIYNTYMIHIYIYIIYIALYLVPSPPPLYSHHYVYIYIYI